MWNGDQEGLMGSARRRKARCTKPGDLYGGVGPWNCPFHAPEGGLGACPYGQGHCGDSGSSWLWKMPLSFTSMTSIPPSRTGDSGSRENRKFRGPDLSALVFLLFFGRWRESDTHSCMLQTQNLPVCYWGLGRMLQRPPPTGSGVLLPAPT